MKLGLTGKQKRKNRWWLFDEQLIISSYYFFFFQILISNYKIFSFTVLYVSPFPLNRNKFGRWGYNKLSFSIYIRFSSSHWETMTRIYFYHQLPLSLYKVKEGRKRTKNIRKGEFNEQEKVEWRILLYKPYIVTFASEIFY